MAAATWRRLRGDAPELPCGHMELLSPPPFFFFFGPPVLGKLLALFWVPPLRCSLVWGADMWEGALSYVVRGDTLYADGCRVARAGGGGPKMEAYPVKIPTQGPPWHGLVH